VVQQVLQHHPRTHAPADEVHPLEPERLHERRDVVGPVAHAAPGVDGQRVCVAVAAQVDGERAHPSGLGQRQHRLLPEERGADVAVHEQHRVARAGRLGAGRLQHVLRQPRRGHAGGGDAGQQDVAHRSPHR
jgi:hypothetical protein